jgi:hypothetical protein
MPGFRLSPNHTTIGCQRDGGRSRSTFICRLSPGVPERLPPAILSAVILFAELALCLVPGSLAGGHEPQLRANSIAASVPNLLNMKNKGGRSFAHRVTLRFFIPCEAESALTLTYDS